MKTLWLLVVLSATSCTAPAFAEEEKEKEPCAKTNGLLICEGPPVPDEVIKILQLLTDPPSHTFFRAEI